MYYVIYTHVLCNAAPRQIVQQAWVRSLDDPALRPISLPRLSLLYQDSLTQTFREIPYEPENYPPYN